MALFAHRSELNPFYVFAPHPSLIFNRRIAMRPLCQDSRPAIDVALADEHWKQTTTSFALEGLSVSLDDCERAGRVIAGQWTVEQAIAQVRQTDLLSY
jgi:hypothetical protein